MKKALIILLFFLMIIPFGSSQNSCGNHKLESGEDCLNCHLDAGCRVGYFCGGEGYCAKKAVPAYMLLFLIPIALVVIVSFYLVSAYTTHGVEKKEVFAALALVLVLAIFAIFLLFNIPSFSTTLSPVTKNTKVLIDDDVAKKVNTLLANASHEFVLCLKGTYADNLFEIRGFSFPPVRESTNTSITYGTCAGFNVIGTIHSHPEGKCGLSGTDKFTFGKKGHPLTAVVCGKNMFSIYGQGNLDEEVYYVIRNLESTRGYSSLLAYSILAIVSMFMIYYTVYFEEHKKDFYTNLSKIYSGLSKEEKIILKYLIEEKKLSVEELGILTEFTKEKIDALLAKLKKMNLVEQKGNMVLLDVKKRW